MDGDPSHLELTAMRGALDDVEHDFKSWLLKINGLRAAMSDDDIVAAAIGGAGLGWYIAAWVVAGAPIAGHRWSDAHKANILETSRLWRKTVGQVAAGHEIPLDHMLGDFDPNAGAGGNTKGFKGAMATFDATRPGVAAMACGIARASLDYLIERLREELEFHRAQLQRDATAGAGGENVADIPKGALLHKVQHHREAILLGQAEQCLVQQRNQHRGQQR